MRDLPADPPEGTDESATVVGIRALKQNASAVVASAAAGRVVTITDRGRPVAQLIPYEENLLDRLIASGRVRPAVGRMSDLGPPEPMAPGESSLTQILAEMRADERY